MLSLWWSFLFLSLTLSLSLNTVRSGFVLFSLCFCFFFFFNFNLNSIFSFFSFHFCACLFSDTRQMKNPERVILAESTYTVVLDFKQVTDTDRRWNYSFTLQILLGSGSCCLCDKNWGSERFRRLGSGGVRIWDKVVIWLYGSIF